MTKHLSFNCGFPPMNFINVHNCRKKMIQTPKLNNEHSTKLRTLEAYVQSECCSPQWKILTCLNELLFFLSIEIRCGAVLFSLYLIFMREYTLQY